MQMQVRYARRLCQITASTVSCIVIASMKNLHDIFHAHSERRLLPVIKPGEKFWIYCTVRTVVRKLPEVEYFSSTEYIFQVPRFNLVHGLLMSGA